jgi:hypothetical protein
MLRDQALAPECSLTSHVSNTTNQDNNSSSSSSNLQPRHKAQRRESNTSKKRSQRLRHTIKKNSMMTKRKRRVSQLRTTLSSRQVNHPVNQEKAVLDSAVISSDKAVKVVKTSTLKEEVAVEEAEAEATEAAKGATEAEVASEVKEVVTEVAINKETPTLMKKVSQWSRKRQMSQREVAVVAIEAAEAASEETEVETEAETEVVAVATEAEVKAEVMMTDQELKVVEAKEEVAEVKEPKTMKVLLLQQHQSKRQPISDQSVD